MEEDDITDFSYRLENTHIIRDRGERYSTSIEGALNKLQQRVYIRYEEANERFIRELTNTLEGKHSLNDEDIRILREYVKYLPLVSYKNPISYCAGYIIAKDIGNSELTAQHLKRIIDSHSIIRVNAVSTKAEIVKYYRFWRTLLYIPSASRDNLQIPVAATEYSDFMQFADDDEEFII